MPHLRDLKVRNSNGFTFKEKVDIEYLYTTYNVYGMNMGATNFGLCKYGLCIYGDTSDYFNSCWLVSELIAHYKKEAMSHQTYHALVKEVRSYQLDQLIKMTHLD